MEIRSLSEADAGLFQALRLCALRESPSAFSSSYGEECGIPVEVVAQRIAGSPDRCVFGAFDQSGLVGCIGIHRGTKAKLAHKAVIWGMYVDPAHRGKGVGRELMAHALRFAASMAGLRNLILSVTNGNSAAVMLYESMGFKVFVVEPDAMLIDNELHDEIHMIRAAKGEP